MVLFWCEELVLIFLGCIPLCSTWYLVKAGGSQRIGWSSQVIWVSFSFIGIIVILNVFPSMHPWYEVWTDTDSSWFVLISLFITVPTFQSHFSFCFLMVSVTVFPLGILCNSFPARKEPIQSRRGQQFQLGFFVVETYLLHRLLSGFPAPSPTK
jgi:hypothetical protein